MCQLIYIFIFYLYFATFFTCFSLFFTYFVHFKFVLIFADVNASDRPGTGTRPGTGPGTMKVPKKPPQCVSPWAEGLQFNSIQLSLVKGK